MRGLHELYHQEDLNINRFLTNSIVETYLDLGASIIARVIYKETPWCEISNYTYMAGVAFIRCENENIQVEFWISFHIYCSAGVGWWYNTFFYKGSLDSADSNSVVFTIAWLIFLVQKYSMLEWN